MLKRILSLIPVWVVIMPTAAWAGPDQDLIKGMQTGKSALVEQALGQGANPKLRTSRKPLTSAMWFNTWRI